MDLPERQASPSESEDGRLAHEFQAIEGNQRLRKAALKGLLSSMTSQEKRDMMRWLQASDFRMDIPSGLPPELLAMVADYLGPADIATILNVSRHWRVIWGHGPASEILARRWMPGFLKYYAMRKTMNQISEDQEQAESFYDEARRLRYRFMDQIGETKWIPIRAGTLPDDAYEPKVRADGRFIIEEMHYCNGKVAWQASHIEHGRRADGPPGHARSSIVVDDITTGDRKIFDYRDRGPFRTPSVILGSHASLVAIGDKLVVAREVRKIYAWDLETGQAGYVMLPIHTRASCISTRGNRVVIPGSYGVVWIWDFVSGHMGGVTLPNWDPKKRMTPSTSIFHPLLNNTFFLVEHGEDGRLPISVHEFVDNDYSRTYSVEGMDEFALPRSEKPWNKMIWFSAAIETNRFGHHQVGATSDSERNQHGLLFPPEVPVCFNVFSRSFSAGPWIYDGRQRPTRDGRRFLEDDHENKTPLPLDDEYALRPRQVNGVVFEAPAEDIQDTDQGKSVEVGRSAFGTDGEYCLTVFDKGYLLQKYGKPKRMMGDSIPFRPREE